MKGTKETHIETRVLSGGEEEEEGLGQRLDSGREETRREERELTLGSDGSLDRREDGSTGNSHDQESGSPSSVSSEVLSRDDEDDGV